MELTKIASKGQVTIPVAIHKNSKLKTEDKALSMEKTDKNNRTSSSMDALSEAQITFSGEAEKAGLKNNKDVINMIKELRKEGSMK